MTEVLPEPEPRPGSRPLLGELLVNAGLVTPEVMAKALAEQQRTGLPIGRILVEGGYIPGHRLAMALADQHGGPVRTEYGFAVGHAQPIAPSPLQQVATTELPSLRVVEPEAEPAAVEPMPPAPQPDPEPAPEPEPEPEPAAVDEERERLVAQIAEAEASLKDLMRLLEQEQEARGKADDDAARERSEREQAEARLRDVAQMLTREKSAREQAEADADELRNGGAASDDLARRLQQQQQARAGAEAAVAAARTDIADLQVKVAELEATVEASAADPRAYPIDRHLLYVPGVERYRLLERTGPPPAPDARLELEGAAFTVLRVGPAPTPDRVACAFLEAVHEEAPA